MEDGGGLGESFWIPWRSPVNAKVQCSTVFTMLIPVTARSEAQQIRFENCPAPLLVLVGEEDNLYREAGGESISRRGNVVIALTFPRNCPRDAGEGGEGR